MKMMIASISWFLQEKITREELFYELRYRGVVRPWQILTERYEFVRWIGRTADRLKHGRSQGSTAEQALDQLLKYWEN